MNNHLNRRTSAVVLAAALGLATVAAHGQSNLVVNGSFEAGPAGQNQFTDWGWVAGAGNNSNFGVAQAGAPPEVAQQGSYFAYFRGHPNDSSQDCLGTEVSLTVGALYNISYYLGTDGPLTNGAAMWAQIGPQFGLSPQCVALPAFFPNSSTALPYQKFSAMWIATNAWPILSFHGVNATNGLAVTNGILLDNVSVVLAYPPLNVSNSPLGPLVFHWANTNSPYRLQANASLLTTNWTTLGNTPVNVGTNSEITLPTPASPQFYRLTLP